MSRPRRRAASAFVARLGAAVAFCFALLTVAEGYGATVAVLSAGSSPALSEAAYRLRGELAALRLRVVLLRRPTLTELGGLDMRAWLERTAEARGIDAAIEIIGGDAPQAVDVWIFQRSPRRTQVARVALRPDTPDRAGTLAIRAIEVLRSYDLEADLAARARERQTESGVPAARESGPAATAGAEQPEHSPPAGSQERAGIELGAGILTGLDGVGPALLPVLRFDWRAGPSLLAQATVSGLGSQPTLRASAGTVRVAQAYGALGLCYCPASGQVLGPYFALAAGVWRTSLAGAADSPARGHALNQWSLLLDAGAGARLRLSSRYHATLTGHVQMAQPRVVIHVVDEQLASTGRPNLIANLMLGAWL